MPGNRVGDPNALIKPGDPIPGKSGAYYEVGQFSPSIETLSVMKLMEAQSAGVLPSKYDVYDDGGMVDEKKLKKINFTQEAMQDYGVQLPTGTPPGVSLIVLATLELLPKAAIHYPNVFRLVFDINTSAVLQGELQQEAAHGQADMQARQEVGTAASTALTGFDYTTRPYTTYLHVYQPFYTYMSVPLIPRVANLNAGLSVSSYSLLNSVAKAIYNRLMFDREALAYRFLEVTGWKELHAIPHADQVHYLRGGKELGVDRDTSWYRDTRVPSLSYLSTVSPLEAFAEGFVQHYLHRRYAAHVTPHLGPFFESLEEFMTARAHKEYR
jgi:hypothetical protein